MAVLATTDLHQNGIGCNYSALTPALSVGMDCTATLIKGARAQNPNHVLLDNGDTIEGTLLGDFQTLAQPIPCSQTLAIHKLMNALQYDAGTLGNHQQRLGGATDFQISAYFALAGDVSATQILNQTQLAYVKNFLTTRTDPAMAAHLWPRAHPLSPQQTRSCSSCWPHVNHARRCGGCQRICQIPN